MNPEILYRYENNADVVFLAQYPVIRRTRCGSWVIHKGKQKFILDVATKRFAYPTEQQAKESFFARKRRHLNILKTQIEAITLAVEALRQGRLEDYDNSLYFD